MLEKEAEERARKLEEKQTLGIYDNDEDRARDEGFNEGEVVGYEKGFKDGAEVGYNKANEELEEKYKETFCNLEMNLNSVTERLEELNKANEWNYVKDGIFPKDEKDILCQINFETYEVGYYHQEKRCFYTIDGREIEVIAWKEIVLPEEI